PLPLSASHTTDLPRLRALPFPPPAAPPIISTLSLHDALPISRLVELARGVDDGPVEPDTPDKSLSAEETFEHDVAEPEVSGSTGDRKSTRLNSSHVSISYAVFCLTKKNEHKELL